MGLSQETQPLDSMEKLVLFYKSVRSIFNSILATGAIPRDYHQDCYLIFIFLMLDAFALAINRIARFIAVAHLQMSLPTGDIPQEFTDDKVLTPVSHLYYPA